MEDVWSLLRLHSVLMRRTEFPCYGLGRRMPNRYIRLQAHKLHLHSPHPWIKAKASDNRLLQKAERHTAYTNVSAAFWRPASPDLKRTLVTVDSRREPRRGTITNAARQ